MSLSYVSCTVVVMSVAMTPGRTSCTRMPSGARRAAYSLVSMDTPALDTQYSPRFKDTTSAEQDETLTMVPRLTLPSIESPIMCFAMSWVKNMLPFELTPSTRS